MSNHNNPSTTSKPKHKKKYMNSSALAAQEENIKGPQAINILYEARDNLRQFANKIGAEKYTPIRHDVLQYCEKVKSAKCQSLNYEKIEKMVKNRIQKMTKNKKIKKNWGQQDIFILIWVISKYADFYSIQSIEKSLNKTNWNHISELIPGTNAESCMFKWLSLRNNRLSQYSWSQRQSLALASLVSKYGEDNWGVISQKLFYSCNSSNKVYRCPKQCREHWCCFLNPNIKKGPWTPQQDWVLFSQVRRKNGLRRWTQLSKIFNGRTQNAIKNRYNFLIQKEKIINNNKNLNDVDLIDQYLERNYVSQFVSHKEEKQQAKKSEKLIYLNKQQDQYYPDKRILRRNRLMKGKSIKRQSMSEIKYQSEQEQIQIQIQNPILIQSSIHQYGNMNQKFSQLGSYIQNQNCLLSQIILKQNQNQSQIKVPELSQDLNKFTLNSQIKQQSQKKSKTQRQSDSVSLQDVKVISLKEEEMQKIKQILFGITKGPITDFKFVPCSINHNRLQKFNLK